MTETRITPHPPEGTRMSGRYVGDQRRNQVRDGEGVYLFTNKFFRYEGRWVDGQMHGKGRLVMKDGSFYEGDFVSGEINGVGRRFSAVTGALYEGDFEDGEAHGRGRLKYADCSEFSGDFSHNKRHGDGQLKHSDCWTYTGEWFDDKQHGAGRIMWDDGSHFEGHFVYGRRLGHGEMSWADGSRYSGQWMFDKQHGDGKLDHVSGLRYYGMWQKGVPANRSRGLRLVEEMIEMEPHGGFTVTCHVVDEDGAPVEQETGRQLIISAAYKFFPGVEEEATQLLDVIEATESEPVKTPFGYDALPYPLADQPPRPVTTLPRPVHDSAEFLDKRDEVDATVTTNTVLNSAAPSDVLVVAPDTGETIPTLEEDTVESRAVTPRGLTAVKTDCGVAAWPSLWLLPPPAGYLPFLQLEAKEEAVAAALVLANEATALSAKTSAKRMKKPLPTPQSVTSGVPDSNKDFHCGDYVIMVEDVTEPPFLDRLEPAFCLVRVSLPPPVVEKPMSKKKSVK